MNKKVSLLLLIFLLTFSLMACSSSANVEKEVKKDKQVVEEFNPEQTKYPLKIKDSYDREITLETEPGTVVSIGPNITETIYAINRGAKLIARTDFDDYPEQVERIESIGSLTEPNIEKIVDMKPDLVIGSTHLKKEVVEKLEKAGIKVAVFYEKEDFGGTYEVIKNVSIAINAQQEAKDIITDMQNKVEEVTMKVKDQKEKSTYYVVGFGEGGEFTAGGDTFIGQMIEMAGGKNAADDAEGWSYSLDKLVEKDPEVIIVTDREGEKEKLMKTNGYKDLTAVKEGKVYTIDENLLNRQGPRLAEGLEQLAKTIHPDVFK